MSNSTQPLVLSAYAAPPAAQAASNPQDIPSIIEAIQQNISDFQAANDERLTEIEKKGGEDAITRQKVETINASITELQKALEDQAKATARLSVGTGDGDINNEFNAARKFFAIATRQRNISAESVNTQAYQEYRNAFDTLLRKGGDINNVSADVSNALSIGSDPAGGYFVPTEMSSEIEKRIFDTSPMRQISRVISIGASAWEAPYKSTDGGNGGWVGEQEDRPATGNSKMGIQRIETHEQYAYPQITQSSLDDSAINLEGYITEEIEDVMGRVENAAFVSGDGIMKPKGFLAYKDSAVTAKDGDRKWGQLQYVVSGHAGGFPNEASGAGNPDALISMISALNPAYRDGASWVMNRTTEAEIRKLKDADGRYLVGFGDLRDTALNFNLLGSPIVNLQDMPDIASDAFPVGYGNFQKGYFIVDRMGIRLLRDPYTKKPYIGYYTTKRVGGDVRNFDAIKLLKMAA
jgi:HK97 family phage major capsid protein